MNKLRKGDTIQVIARRWFEKTNGNTYHSVAVYVNNRPMGREDFDYGYGTHYQQCAREILERSFDLGLEKHEALWHLKDQGIEILDNVTDVARKRDL